MDVTKAEKDQHLLAVARVIVQTLYYDIDGVTGDTRAPFGRRGIWSVAEDILQIIHLPPDGRINNVTGFRPYTSEQLEYAMQLWREVLPFMQSRCELVLKDGR